MNIEDFKKELEQFKNGTLDTIVIHPDMMEYLMEQQNNSFFGKLKYGWKLFHLSYQDWMDAMYSEDYVEEFFDYLGYGGTYD